MSKKIKITYIDAPNDQERQSKIVEILAEGLNAYLKAKNILRRKPKSAKKIKSAMEEARQISQKISEENMPSEEVDIN